MIKVGVVGRGYSLLVPYVRTVLVLDGIIMNRARNQAFLSAFLTAREDRGASKTSPKVR